MCFEKRKLLFRKLFCIFFAPLLTIVPYLIWEATPYEMPPETELELLKDSIYIDTYYEYLEETTLSVELKFNQVVNSSGTVDISFFSEDDELLETKTINISHDYFAYDDSLLTNDYFTVKGKVASYEILEYDVEAADPVIPTFYDSALHSVSLIGGILLALSIVPPFCLITLDFIFFQKCKIYHYKGQEILVYAGALHYYVKINGEKTDQADSFTFFSIELSGYLDTGEAVNVKISPLLALITVKINGKMINT